jgi:hypothetical protein
MGDRPLPTVRDPCPPISRKLLPVRSPSRNGERVLFLLPPARSPLTTCVAPHSRSMSAVSAFLASPIVRRLPTWPVPVEALQTEWQNAWSATILSSQYQSSMDWRALVEVINQACRTGQQLEIHMVAVATEMKWPKSGSRMVTEMRRIRILINAGTQPRLAVRKAPAPLQPPQPIRPTRLFVASKDSSEWMPFTRQLVMGDLDQAIAKLEDDLCRGPVAPASNRK